MPQQKNNKIDLYTIHYGIGYKLKHIGPIFFEESDEENEEESKGQKEKLNTILNLCRNASKIK